MSDVKDLIRRLTQLAKHRESVETFDAGFDAEMEDHLAPALIEAPAALERLSAERDAARRALRRIASRNFVYLTNSGSDNPAEDVARSLYREWKAIMEIARAALKAEPVAMSGSER